MKKVAAAYIRKHGGVSTAHNSSVSASGEDALELSTQAQQPGLVFNDVDNDADVESDESESRSSTMETSENESHITADTSEGNDTESDVRIDEGEAM
jgi:hypothetical protein